MTGEAWDGVRARAARPPRFRTAAENERLADPWRADPWGLCRARWVWWGGLALAPLRWAGRHWRQVAFYYAPPWRRRRALARLALARAEGRRAATARVAGSPLAPWHLARAVALWREARALAGGLWC